MAVSIFSLKNTFLTPLLGICISIYMNKTNDLYILNKRCYKLKTYWHMRPMKALLYCESTGSDRCDFKRPFKNPWIPLLLTEAKTPFSL